MTYSCANSPVVLKQCAQSFKSAIVFVSNQSKWQYSLQAASHWRM